MQRHEQYWKQRATSFSDITLLRQGTAGVAQTNEHPHMVGVVLGYVSQNPVEKAKLLRMLFSNCSVDAVSVTPTYRKSFDMIFERARSEKWSGRLDSNYRPHPPQS
jgi:hypothetical protein